QVTLVNETKLEGTAGTLIKNLDFFQAKDGLLIHADNYCLADFIAFQEAHHNRPPECLMTMMTFRTDDPSSCGIVDLDERGIVTGFYEKLINPPENLANGAIYIISKELFPLLTKKSNEFTDFSKDVIPKLLGKIYTYETNSVMIDIGSPIAYEKANLIST
ncbi:MAG: nucleotidyltransferase family protein, partial [Candidatus Methylopumilus sp.]|nr:nucleotidyltransferase family protein [Candidatus Methylopumilus sp.]